MNVYFVIFVYADMMSHTKLFSIVPLCAVLVIVGVILASQVTLWFYDADKVNLIFNSI